MMKIHRSALLSLSLLGALVANLPARPSAEIRAVVTPQNGQDEVVLVLSNAANHYRVGLPDFLAPAGDPELAAAGKALADVLWDDVDYEKEYYMIPRRSSGTVPAASPEALPFDRWTSLGADYVLVGAVSRSGANMSVQVRLVTVKGTDRGKVAFAAEYPNCRAQNPRFCAHAIADHFHKETRQLDGVARTKLAFVSDRDSSRVVGRPSQTAAEGKEIYFADYDGANTTRFTVNRSLNLSPSWSPTGDLLAYTSYASGFPDIYVANLAEPGRPLQRPAAGSERVQNQLAAWSPDGAMLAFTSNRAGPGNSDIWVVNRDGSGLRNLTNNPAMDWAPAWSPSGQQIAFASDRAGGKHLYVMSVNGTGLQRLVDLEIDRPTWSPLNFIAFTVASKAGYDVGIYDFASPGVKILTDGIGSNESPSVSPNGRHIAFFTTRWGKQQIATIDRTGQNLRRITDAGNNTYPNWQPITNR